MERIMSVEDKIKRAEEIYNRRKENQARNSTAKVPINNKKDIKLLKKMFVQIIICLAIYSVFYLVKNNNYIFSEDLLNKSKEILNYDVNFSAIYSNYIEALKEQGGASAGGDEQNPESTNTENVEDEGIGGAAEEEKENSSGLSQMEQDALSIKNSINFINPVEGTITSNFGARNPTTTTVPKYHTGIDIAAASGTAIRSATNGNVVLASSEGDYGNHLKIQIDDVSIIYAHCKKINVNQGDNVMQGQEIAEVGSTGNSTGPHLHFEIRKQDRFVDPKLILNM